MYALMVYIYEPLLSSIFLLPIPNLRVFRLQERRPDGLFEVMARTYGPRKFLEELEVNVYGRSLEWTSERGWARLVRTILMLCIYWKCS